MHPSSRSSTAVASHRVDIVPAPAPSPCLSPSCAPIVSSPVLAEQETDHRCFPGFTETEDSLGDEGGPLLWGAADAPRTSERLD